MKYAAALVMLDVVLVYVYCLAIAKTYPPSHPWSGIALILLALGLISRSRRAAAQSWLMPALAVIAAALWTVAAILGR